MVGGGGRIHRPRRHQMMRTASTRRTTVQDLDLEMGRPSAISTVSPSLYWLASSCALYLAVRFTNLPSTGCFTRVWTLTTTVLAILLLTTLPTIVRCCLGVCSWVSVGMLLSCVLSHDGAVACHVAAHLAQLAGVGMLLGGALHAQVDLWLPQALEVGLQPGGALRAQFT